jgi:uncharacterized protein (DUF697 family)
VNPLSVLNAAQDVGEGSGRYGPVVVSGTAHGAAELAAALARDAVPGVVRDATGRGLEDSDLDGAAILVHVFAGSPGAVGEAAFELGARKGLQLIAVAVGAPEDLRLKLVAGSDLIRVAAPPVPVEKVAGRIAARAGKTAYALAAAMPSVRREAVDRIINSSTRKNAVVGAAVFMPGVDMAAMTMTQVQMVLRIAAAYGYRLDTRDRMAEIAAVVGAAFGWRGLARQLVTHVPGPTWIFRAGVGAAGTKVVGEAAAAYFESKLQGDGTPPPPAASPGSPTSSADVVRSGS